MQFTLKIVTYSLFAALLNINVSAATENAFDLINNQLFYNTVNVHLTVKESQLLRLLIEHNGEPLSFESIEEVIWANESTSNNAIQTLVYRLRGKIKSNLIEKVFGYGIRLVIA